MLYWKVIAEELPMDIQRFQGLDIVLRLQPFRDRGSPISPAAISRTPAARG